MFENQNVKILVESFWLHLRHLRNTPARPFKPRLQLLDVLGSFDFGERKTPLQHLPHHLEEGCHSLSTPQTPVRDYITDTEVSQTPNSLSFYPVELAARF